ncbi:MAG: SPOR domain-containing protein [Pseudomonadota bacterium]
MRIVAALVLGFAVSGCSTIIGGGKVEDITGDEPSEVNWTFADSTKLRSEIDKLKAENSALQRALRKEQKAKAAAEQALSDSRERVATLAEAAASADAPIMAESPPQTPNASDLRDETAIVAAASAETALAADAPKPSPRLVQPTFSDERPVFENEAGVGEIQLASVLFGVHLETYRNVDGARNGWVTLQRANPDELGLLEPRVEQITLPERGVFYRLIGGGFSSQTKASALCERLKAKEQYCVVSPFAGDKLSLTKATG